MMEWESIEHPYNDNGNYDVAVLSMISTLNQFYLWVPSRLSAPDLGVDMDDVL